MVKLQKPKKPKLSKEVCKYCDGRIPEGKLSFINCETFCNECFNRIKNWGRENKHAEQQARLGRMKQFLQ